MTDNNDMFERNIRLPIRLLVNFDNPQFSGNFFIENLSSGGLFIETESPLPKSTKFTIEFTLPHNREQYTIDALVVWSRSKREENLAPGMGISFEAMDENKKEMLGRAIKQYKELIGEE